MRFPEQDLPSMSRWGGGTAAPHFPACPQGPACSKPPPPPHQAIPSIFLAPRNSPLEKSWEKLSDEYVMGVCRMCVRDL